MNTLIPNPRMVRIDRSLRRATIDGVPLALGEKEYAILETLTEIARGRREKRASAIAELLKAFHVS